MRDLELERLKNEFALQKREGRPVKAKDLTDAQLADGKMKVRGLCSLLGITPSEMHHVGWGMFMGVVMVHPGQAMAWLEKRNLNNRNEAKAGIQILAGDILNDRWFVTHQGLAFDYDVNELIDGQHRLGAIVEANRPVPVLVAMYSVKERRAKVDLVNTRKFTEQMKIVYGMEISKAVVAATRAYVQGVTTFSPARGHDELRGMIEQHHEPIQWAFDNFHALGHRKNITVGPVTAAIARAYHYVKPLERLKRFCQVLHEGAYDKDAPPETTIIALRTFLTNEASGVKARTTNVELFRKTQWAISRYLDGHVSKKSIQVSEDLFPIPEEE